MVVRWGNRILGIRLIALVVVLGAIQPAVAQFESEGLELYSNLGLGAFGANSGNDCWGYVSGSGREYAIMAAASCGKTGSTTTLSPLESST